jgi:putative heme-binding domain-containing protein
LDFDENARSLEGLLAFQIHRGPAMTVQIKDVFLKELPEGGVVSFAKSAIPSDAQIIENKAPPRRARAASRRRRPAEVGPAIGENKATPVERISTPEGFQVELLYSVPGLEQGSWANLCSDEKGRIYASDQYGSLYRFNPPAPGQTLKKEDVHKVPAEIRAINGMLFAFGALYVGVNDYEQKMQSGLYRLTDSTGDDQLDKVELLRAIDSKSDHGVHAVVLTPDGQGLYLVCGNNAILTETTKASPVRKFWGDDHLLPRMPDGRGHNRHVMAPGGIIYKVSPDGKEFEIFANGFRNIYDASVNSDGELFTYDADMEYDFNTSWYRPTRVNHVVSGAEFGWRNGTGKYPEFYVDNLPATLNIGPGSPTGTTFGYGAKFPAKYQSAFYAIDWSWGKIYAVHLEPNGSTYTGTKEEFVTGGPLPVTDAIIHKDGAMYFAIGGRRVQSGLYRVTYTGSVSTDPIDLTPKTTPQRDLRLSLSAFHGKQDPRAVATVWPYLNHSDRFIRAAARTALEHQPLGEWQDKALAEPDATRQLEALLALTRITGVCPTHREEEATVNTEMRDLLLSTMLKHDFAKLTKEQRLAYVRILQIVLNRFGNPDEATITAIISQLDPSFPADSFELNWLLCETLAYLQAPATAAKGMALIAAAESQEPQIEYARSLRHLKVGWTKELRTQQLEWFLKAANYNGGASFSKFIEFIRNDSLATFTDAEESDLAALIERKPVKKSAIELSGEIFAGRTPKAWTLDELSAATSTGLQNRNFDNGRKMFGAGACFACHRFGNAGGMTGPDLTGAGGRYSPHDLLDQIINPSKEINEQFAPIIVTRENGDVLSGVVVNLSGDNITLNTDLSDPNQRSNVDRKTVKSIEPSKVSLMPPGLLMMLTKEEIMDLVAYTLSMGDKTNPMFKQ